MSTRELPLDLAAKLNAAAGGVAMAFDGIRMDDIATASGIPRATLYYYFAGKDDVLAFLLRSMLDDLRVSVATALDIEGSAERRLHAVVRAQLAHLAANPAAAQLLVMNLGRAGRLGDIGSGIEDGFHAPVRRVLADGVEAGELGDVDVEVTAIAIYGAVTLAGLQSLLTTGAIDVEDMAGRLFPIVWSGVVADRLRTETREP